MGQTGMEELLNSVGALAALSAGVEVFAAAVAGLLLVACFLEGGHRRQATRYLMAILAIHVVLLASDAAVWILDCIPGHETAERLLVLLVDFLGYLALALFTCFTAEFIGHFAPVSRWVVRGACATCAAMAVLWAAATVCGGLAYQFADGSYVEGLFYWAGTASAIAMLAFNMLLVLRYSKVLELRATVILLLYSILPLIGYALQPYWPVTPIYLGSVMALVLCYAVIHVDQSRQLAQREHDLAESRVAIAVSQIQPHFLFNALNSICYLCESNPKEAQGALREFSGYLRTNIDSIGVTRPVPFSAELDHVKTYLKLEKMRFEDDLNIEYDIETTAFKVPPLSVQPLVENAVKHGVCKKPGGGTVRLCTQEHADRFEVVVRDDGAGFDTAAAPNDGREHVGIRNVRQRLWAMCNASLAVESKPGCGTTATISIPKEGNRA